jgi:hypothetical protein
MSASFYTNWIEPSHQLHSVRYLDEQLRKAALLPQNQKQRVGERPSARRGA